MTVSGEYLRMAKSDIFVPKYSPVQENLLQSNSHNASVKILWIKRYFLICYKSENFKNIFFHIMKLEIKTFQLK